ncbi:MAG: carbohydrate ABC transporter permease [Anaerolineae bacterium]
MIRLLVRRYGRNYLVETGWMYFFILPWIIGFVLWTAGPMLYSIYLSFTKYEILTSPVWVGAKNYVTLWSDPLFWQSLKVTTVYSFVSLPLGLFGSLAVAVLMNQKVPGMSYWRTIYYLPAVVSGVPVAILWRWLFNPEFGIINWLLWTLFHVQGPMWLYSKEWVLPAFIVMSLWGLGGGMVIYLAALQGVPTEIYEAAELDGASAGRKFMSVTMPMISPVIFFNLVMGIIGSFQVFTSSFVMTAGGPGNASLFYLLYLYRNAWQYLKMGYASALAWVLFLITMVLTLLTFRSAGAWVYYEGALKGR